jgi:hypothetical protein
MNNKEAHTNAHESSGTRSSLIDNLQKEVDAAAKFGICQMVNVESLADQPITISVSRRVNDSRHDLGSALSFIARKLSPKDGLHQFLFRGVKLNQLEHVARSGCDVTPSTAPLHASEYPNKALEYGDLIMVFDPDKLDKTFRIVPKSENPETLSHIREEYPTEIETDVGELWFSKFPREDGRLGTIYESYYTFFIPGDPREALLMLFIIGEESQ